MSAAVLAAIVCGAIGLGLTAARGDESNVTGEPPAAAPTAQQTKEAIEAARPGQPAEPAETDLEVAQELPHRGLGREEALELAEGVFGAQLEEPAGIYADIEAKRYLSDYAAVVPASTVAGISGEEGGQHAPEPPPDAGVLLESSLPLRVENAEGEEETVDLNLQSPEEPGGPLEPANPLVEVEAPAHLGEGIGLPGPEVGIRVDGAPAEQSPSDVEGTYAFYPNIAQDTDLAVAPTPTGVDLMSDIRSAEAPSTATYELSLPDGASLEQGAKGTVEVIEGGRTVVLIPPPTATDAAGEPVPATQTIEGDKLVVEVSPESSTQFPILLDPAFIVESWNWVWWHEAQTAWTPSSNAASLGTFPYAFWEAWGSPPNPSPAPGLDLTSGGWGNGFYGASAQWLYTVPRYNQDIARYGSPPTSFISYFVTEDDWFLTHGNSENYPVTVLGLVDPASPGWWAPNDVAHYGGQGDFAGVTYGFTNPSSDPNTKAADFDLVTYENEYPGKYRDAYVGSASVVVVDQDAPRILSLTAPTGWLTGTSAQTIGYGFEDTGLGVFSATVRLPGETSSYKGLADFHCAGTVVSPCPRVAQSTESGRPALPFSPAELPTGRDILEVTVGDLFWGAGHEATGNVAVKIDNTAPEISLSGPLTEQEALGITKTEYPLAISVSDGSEDDPPQSGVASVEVKVDGKKVTMPKEELWHPACQTQDCPFAGGWTLKASEYAPGDHEVEVIATDAVGHVARETLEVELGVVPPQTSFTSPHPSYRGTEISTIGFKATRAGAPAPGATFRCSFDGSGGPPSEPCTSPFKLEGLKPGPHTFMVAAEEGGKPDPTPAMWKFSTEEYPQAPAAEKLVYPEVGKKTASYYTLEAEWGEAPEGIAAQGVTGVWFQMELPGKVKNEKGEEVPRPFETVPAGCTVDGQGRQATWPLPARSHPGHSAPVYLKVRGCPAFEAAGYPEKEIEFRAVFDGGEKVAGVSEPAATEFVSRFEANRVPTDATGSVGPATVDLLTGAFTLSRTDVSIPIPGYEANLEFTRTYGSTVDKSMPAYSKVLGGAWQPASPLESEYEGEAWTRVEEKEIPERPAVFENYCWPEWEEEEDEEGNVYRVNEHEECELVEVEEKQPREVWIELVNNEGAGVPFEIKGTELVPPEYARELGLRRVGNSIVLAYPNGTHTTFGLPQGSTLPEGKRLYLPSSISYQANANSMRMVYRTEPGSKALRLTEEVSPTPVGGAPCEENETARKTAGCRSLVFSYESMALGAGQTATVLKSIGYFGPAGTGAGQIVAWYSYGVASLEGGELAPALTGESDPRLAIGPEKYEYAASPRGNLLTSVKPSGQEPWSFEYGTAPSGRPVATRLKSVARAGAKTTIAYEVPVNGSGAPYEMGSESIAGWGETDLPVDATAIFPPTHVPSEYPPHEYTGATVHYMDPEGHEIDTASPSPPGVSGQSITTTETDVHGDVIRELSAKNRLVALASPEPVTRSHELDTHSVFSANGNEELESWGPLHQVRLASGELVEARQHTVTRYDEEEPTPPVGTPWAYLPTKETVAAVVPGEEGELEARTTETHYNWALRKPEETIVDPGGLNIRTVTHYNAAGQVVETRQPRGAAGGTAGDAVTVYYSAGGSGECSGHPVYSNLPCKVQPAAQASGAGREKLLVTKFSRYDYLDEPEEVVESPAGEGTEVRKTTTTYDLAGRQLTSKIEGGGIAATTSKTAKTVYSPTLGLPERQEFVCETGCTGFDSQATITTYNALGQVTKYEDADGNVTEAKYDSYGRPSSVTDGKGTQTFHYDEASALLTSLEVSGVGTFTASYDADGDLIRQDLPNGLTATTTFNQADEAIKLAYTKTSSCGESCTWYEESLERSAEGRILSGSSPLVKDRYTYDKAGRLTEAQETPTGGQCTSRLYTFDADSNRLTKTTRGPGVGGACPTSGGTVQKYEYDNADRLMGPTYDAWGRITSLPAEFAGGKALTTSYFANDMVAKQEQNGVTNTFQLDATGRQRQREQTGGVAGVEVFHYDGSGDSPSWTSLGSTWSRNIVGIGGELAAVQESTGTVTFKLTNLHGDVVASASASPTATKLLATFRSDEFGEPESGSAGRFGWLGGHARRTELSSGVVQMGARSYIPQLGRFLTPDPIAGGSANAYDYTNQDPINAFDLRGTCPHSRQHVGRACPGHNPGHENHYGKGKKGGGGHKGSPPKPKLIQHHTVTVTGAGIAKAGGSIGATFTYSARESVSVSAYVTFRGQTSETATARGPSGTVLISPVGYSGTAYPGETLTVCVVAVGNDQSERRCYNHEIVVENYPL